MKRLVVAMVATAAFTWGCADWDELGCEAGDLSYCRKDGGGETMTGGGGATGGGGGATGGGGGTTGGGGGGTTGGGGGGTTGGGGGGTTGGGGGGTTGGGGGTTGGGGGGATGGGTGGGGGGALTLSAVSPDFVNGVGSTETFTLSGTLFTATTTVELIGPSGAFACRTLSLVNETTMTCGVPTPMALGTYAVAVIEGSTRKTLNDAFFSAGDPSVWFDATDAGSVTRTGSVVSQLEDRSRYGRHLAQATASQMPTYKLGSLGSKNTLGFSATSQTVLSSQTPAIVMGNTARTIAFVGRFSSTSTGFIFGFGLNPFAVRGVSGQLRVDNSTVTSLDTLTQFSPNTAFRFVLTCSGTAAFSSSCVVRVDGIIRTVSSGGNTSALMNTVNNGLYLGGYGTSFFDGDVSEVIVYPVALSQTELDALNAYFVRKYP